MNQQPRSYYQEEEPVTQNEKAEKIVTGQLSRLSKRDDWAEDDTAVGGQAAHIVRLLSEAGLLRTLPKGQSTERARQAEIRNEREDRTATWGTCSNQDCLTSMVIYPQADRQTDLPDEDEWENSTFFIECPVCDSNMDWGGTDHPADIILNY
ncbi:hypothetical protein [Arthrobacter sp. B1805]|uniref:hypothetical protein n=1 Tax=Arthrobacter sp. B1805 TaxID=2058892 RepID=UPI0011B07E34|nr:hypothetical protein [Arthrobacter sp. B1805]